MTIPFFTNAQDTSQTERYLNELILQINSALGVNQGTGGSFSNVGRNVLHNGLFVIQQRGAGPWTASSYGPDRWYANFVGGDTGTASIVTLADADRAQIGDEGAQYALQRQFTGSAGGTAFSDTEHAIENIMRFTGKTLIVSFWAKAASGTPSLGINLYISYGSGGTPSGATWNQATGIAVTLGPTWARYSVMFAVQSAAGKTLGTNGDDALYPSFGYSSGPNNNAAYGNIGVQSNTVTLWGVQVEIAQSGQTQPTPLEKRDRQLELANCQRFYQTGEAGWWGYGPAGNLIGKDVMFPVRMRAIPGIVLNTITYGNASALASSGVNPFGMILTATATAAAAASFQCGWTASADL
jgi:hypothetical protein